MLKEYIRKEFEKLGNIEKIIYGLLALFIVLFLYHILLFCYTESLNLIFGIEKESELNIGVIGDSLAVLSFGILAYSLIQSTEALKMQSRDLELNREELKLNREELKANREEAEKANMIKYQCEILENIRTLAENIETTKEGDKWSVETKNVVIRLNLSSLIKNYPATLETLVKIVREEENQLLKDFVGDVIDKNKDKLSYLKFPKKIDLREAQLQNANLSRSQLKYAHLSGAQLQYAHLSGAQLKYAYLSRAQLQYADLSRMQLQNADLSGTQLQYADLSGAQLQYAYLSGVQLQNADLSRTQLKYACLCRANLKNAKNLTAEQLSEAVSLYKIENIDPDLEKEIKEKYPNLLEPNYEIKQCNDQGKGLSFKQYIEKISG